MLYIHFSPKLGRDIHPFWFSAAFFSFKAIQESAHIPVCHLTQAVAVAVEFDDIRYIHVQLPVVILKDQLSYF